MSLYKYLGEEPQSGPTYDVPEPPAPELEPIGEKHEIRLAVIEVEAQCEILYGRRFLPEEGLDLWKQLRHCNGDEENDGQRREKIVKKFRRWVSRLAGKLNFILGSRSTGQGRTPLAETNKRWIKIADAARVSAINRGVISRAADNGEIETNGKKGRSRRLDTTSVTHWVLDRISKPERQETNEAIRRKLDALGDD